MNWRKIRILATWYCDPDVSALNQELKDERTARIEARPAATRDSLSPQPQVQSSAVVQPPIRTFVHSQ